MTQQLKFNYLREANFENAEYSDDPTVEATGFVTYTFADGSDVIVPVNSPLVKSMGVLMQFQMDVFEANENGNFDLQLFWEDKA